MRWSVLVLCVLCVPAMGCEKPDSVELGDACKGSAECKDPSDTCMEVAGLGKGKRCTMECDEKNRCPEGYVCPVTDPSDKTKGSCLPTADIPDNVVTVY